MIGNIILVVMVFVGTAAGLEIGYRFVTWVSRSTPEATVIDPDQPPGTLYDKRH